MAELTMVEAINLALHQEMERNPLMVVLGEDIGVNGGMFRVTEGLIEDYGDERVLDTPLAESAIVGMSIGMALAGLTPVVELQFSGFSYFGFHQIESHAARYRWRSQGRFNLPMVIRMPYGGGVRALEHHSESREVYFAHTPGLKTVIPSSPRNARGLLVSAMRDPDPVIFMEPKTLYRSFREEVPDESEAYPLGKSNYARKGKDVTIIAYGAMLQQALEAADRLEEKENIEADVIDLLTIAPLDSSLFVESARKTGRVVIVHEAPESFGPAGEIIAQLVERDFYFLEAPIERVCGYDTIIPFYAREKEYLPTAHRIASAVHRVLAPR